MCYRVGWECLPTSMRALNAHLQTLARMHTHTHTQKLPNPIRSTLQLVADDLVHGSADRQVRDPPYLHASAAIGGMIPGPVFCRLRINRTYLAILAGKEGH